MALRKRTKQKSTKTTKTKKARNPIPDHMTNQIRWLEYVIGVSLKAAEDPSESIRDLFLAQAARCEHALDKIKELANAIS